MKITIVSMLLVLFSVSANAACTGLVKIEKLFPREGGWVHIQAEGVTDIDVMNCGINNYWGMLLNFNDTSGTGEGKKMLYSTLLTAFAAGKMMKLCSSGCDSQHPSYSRLSHINELQ